MIFIVEPTIDSPEMAMAMSILILLRFLNRGNCGNQWMRKCEARIREDLVFEL
jgi:hypothetical protein